MCLGRRPLATVKAVLGKTYVVLCLHFMWILLVAYKQLYIRIRPSVRPSIPPSFRRLRFFLTAEFKPKGDLTSINAPAQRTRLIMVNCASYLGLIRGRFEIIGKFENIGRNLFGNGRVDVDVFQYFWLIKRVAAANLQLGRQVRNGNWEKKIKQGRHPPNSGEKPLSLRFTWIYLKFRYFRIVKKMRYGPTDQRTDGRTNELTHVRD